MFEQIPIMTEQEMIDCVMNKYQEWIDFHTEQGNNGERVISMILARELRKALEREEINNYVQHSK